MKRAFIIILSLFSTAFSATAAENDYKPFPYKSKTAALMAQRTDDFIGVMAYDQNYLMETFSNRNFHDKRKMKRDEIKFQISLALPIWRGIFGRDSVLAGTYTQRSWFQMTNTEESSPFRETNYEPQLFVAWQTQYPFISGWTINDIETGFNHESNGRSNNDEKSRSWNRLYMRASASKNNWIVEIKPWWRIPEKNKDDDNPDLTKYRGYFDLTVGYRYNEHQFKLTGHYHPRYGKGGVEATYSYPLTRYIRFYTQYYGGYGESLIDYNRNIQRIGIGISLNNVF